MKFAIINSTGTFWDANEGLAVPGERGGKAQVAPALPSAGLLFVALSYRWLSKDHPDPDGFHLGIVAAVAKLYMDKKWNKSPLTAAFDAKGLGAPDFALFCARR